MSESSPSIICLMGPTAVGKTELALELARRFGAEIVSVDSAQVYRGMDIGTAKPAESVRRQIPHHLIDIRDPAEPYSAADFAADAAAVIRDIKARGRLPLLAGGTMLYFRALLEGLSPLPSADPSLRESLDAEERRSGLETLYERLKRLDPATAARLEPGDSQRIKRALEVHELAGAPMSVLIGRQQEQPSAYECLKLVLVPEDRGSLHERIERRFYAMLENGLVEEVRALHERGDLNEEMPAIRSVGYRQVWRYLDGQLDYESMVAKGIAATRQLAKRQLTWLRREKRAVRLKQNGDSVLAHAVVEVSRFLPVRP